jgi:hypothetical protein
MHHCDQFHGPLYCQFCGKPLPDGEQPNHELAELRAFKQAVMDPENQPSQFGTVLATQP